MAENASQSIENPLASGGLERPPDPCHNCSAQRPSSPAQQKKGEKMVNCFLKTERISSSGINHLGLR